MILALYVTLFPHNGLGSFEPTIKKNYLFKRHDSGLLEEGPSLRKKTILKPVVPN
jgi:hypothetical protein